MMKRILLVLLLCALALALVACGNSADTPSDTPTPSVKHEIKWIDEHGTQLAVTEVEEGAAPSYTYTPADTAEWDYTLDGWSIAQGGEPLSTIPAATSNATYYAVVSRVKREYTVTFNANGGSAVAPITVEYGTVINEPAAPERDGFRFVGWCSDASLESAVDWTAPVVGNATYYAVWNEKVDIGAYLEALLSGYEMNPYSYIPEAMRPDYSANLIDAETPITDYSSFVSVSDITCGGFGEQWDMIITNLNQSTVFFNILTVVEALSSGSVVAFNNYLDENPADTASHSFKDGIYNVAISFEGQIIAYVVDYTDTLPVLGEQTVQIALAMDVTTGERTVRVQLGDANAIAYTMTESSYEFAIKYLGVRRAYFSVSEDESGLLSGHIYEFLTAGGVEVASAADFYITDDYAVAVGNKADGMIGFSGCISETYDVSTGRLIGYEVEETLSSITYNTLWFDLSAFTGIDSIRYEAATEDTAAAFFVNGSTTAWEAKTVGGIGVKMFSRRFDIEFRTQYFYTYDAVNDEYVRIAAEVPMLFVQEENYDTLIADVESTNGVTLSMTVSDTDLEAITAFYDELVPVFKTNKENVSSEDIVTFIGEKITLI